MIVRIYNERFVFEEILHFSDEDEFAVQYKQDWLNTPEITYEINEVPSNHMLYGWMECFFQSDYSFDLGFTHIQFIKSGRG